MSAHEQQPGLWQSRSDAALSPARPPNRPDSNEPRVDHVTLNESHQPARLGKYVIHAKIGSGAMGTVYRARHVDTKQDAALKLLRLSPHSKQLLRRFRTEVEALSRLRHPGICRIYEVGAAAVAGGVAPYLVMEMVSGVGLDVYITRNNPSLEQRIRLIIRLCEPVEHAHQRGIIHRDLKPANILVNEAGEVRVLDFGIARAIDADLSHSNAATQSGTLVGTLAYMSPEQASGEPERLDTRSDVYSLGVIGYELLGGRLPYELRGKPMEQILRAIRTEAPVPLSKLNASCGGDLEMIFTKALQKRRHDRYDSASALADDLRRYLANEPIHARRPKIWSAIQSMARRTRQAVDAVGGRVGHVLHRQHAAAETPAKTDPSPAQPPAAHVPGGGSTLRWTTWQDRLRQGVGQLHDGDYASALLWFVAALQRSLGEEQVEWNLRTRITMMLQQSPRLLDLDASTIEPAPIPPPDRMLEIANDERRSAFHVRMTDPATGRTLLGPLWHHAPVGESHFSGDGELIVTICRDDIARVWSAMHDSSLRHRGLAEAPVTCVRFSPIGDQIAATVASGQVLLLRADDLQVIARMSHDAPARAAAFSHDGTLLVSGADDRTARVWDANSGRPIGAPIAHERPIQEVHFVREGKQVVAVQSDGTVQVWEISTGKAFTPPMNPNTPVYRALMRDARRRGAPEFAPHYLALEVAPPLARLMAAAGGATPAEPKQGAGRLAFAALSPDGRLAVVIHSAGDAHLWDVRNTTSLSAPLDRDHRVCHAHFSPDSRKLVTGSSNGFVRVWSVIPDPRAAEELKVIAEVLSCHIIDDSLGPYPLNATDWQAAWNHARHVHRELFCAR